jgi:catechol 2,3-dioxygenase-like lactoylglutathione lyase family enzyme
VDSDPLSGSVRSEFLVTHAPDAHEGEERVDARTWTLRSCAAGSEESPYADAMIAGAHTILFAPDADAARGFLRDVLELDAVDAGGGWLIFALPPGEIACHPAEGGPASTELYLMCEDVEAARAELEGRGVEFTAPVSKEAWGLLTRFRVPGYGELGLYEPRHASPLAAFG